MKASNESLGNRLLEWHGGMGSGLYSVGSCLLANATVSIDEVVRAINELRVALSKAQSQDCVTEEDEYECQKLSNELEDKYQDEIPLHQLVDDGLSSILIPRRET